MRDGEPKRKAVRLPEYDYSSPGAYFVTICTQGRRRILSDVTVGAGALDGPRVVLTPIGEIVEKYVLSTKRIPGLHVDKYVIMPNHIHMMLCITAESGPSRAPAPTNALIPRAVASLKRFVNAELGEDIWQRSYHEHVIRNEKDYREVWEYIDNNPARWAEDRYFAE